MNTNQSRAGTNGQARVNVWSDDIGPRDTLHITKGKRVVRNGQFIIYTREWYRFLRTVLTPVHGTPTAYAVFCHLANDLEVHDRNRVMYHVKDIGHALQVSRSTIYEALGMLIRAGVVKRLAPTVVELNPSMVW